MKTGRAVPDGGRAGLAAAPEPTFSQIAKTPGAKA
jgi:hypothetical protein